MERKNWIWLIVILAFCILAVWALIVMFNGGSKELTGTPGVVVTSDGDAQSDGPQSEINSVIDNTIVSEEDDLDLGNVIT